MAVLKYSGISSFDKKIFKKAEKMSVGSFSDYREGMCCAESMLKERNLLNFPSELPE